DLDDDPEDFTETSDTWNSPELIVIPLPSNLGVDRCRRLMAEDLIPLEMSLRKGRQMMHFTTSAFTCATRQSYSERRIQMMKLDTGHGQLQKYKSLLHEQLKVSTAVGDPNACGQQNESLAWFWSVEVDMRGPDQSWNEECKGTTGLMEGRADVGPIRDGLDMNHSRNDFWVMHATPEGNPESPGIGWCDTPASAMPELYPSPASTSDNQNLLDEYWPLTLTPTDISATMSMSALRIHASISQYQVEAANNNLPPLARIRHFKAGLQWEITTFVMPILQYSAARNIISVVPSPIAHILHLIPGHTWNTVLDHIFSYHIYPGDPSRIVSGYDTPWWMGETAILDEPWQWDWVMTCCIFHYQHWLDGVENDGLTILEQVDHTSVP
ncbi:uncharacterized protein EDB93DRAFT_1109674, partial [Suillus bovinus]|uniref:uncharacterized protein n=1 Tax=Suillus bovinus TaxID=48563 RepID=UPI001B876344